MRRTFVGVELYVLVTELPGGLPWRTAAELALAGGAQALQLREKHLPHEQLLERAHVLRTLCDLHGALLIVNDHPDLAASAGADGVHVGQDDLPAAQARALAGAGRLVGVSTHTLDQARAALSAAPDYIAVGPMFPSSTKPQPHLAGPQTLRAVRHISALPLVAIGGISSANAPLLAAADALAVCSAVLCAGDPRAAAADLLAAFRSARAQFNHPRGASQAIRRGGPARGTRLQTGD